MDKDRKQMDRIPGSGLGKALGSGLGKAMLVVSFGTSHVKTCEETIGAIESSLAKAMPDRRLYRAWTSSFIIRKLRERDGIEIDTVKEALDRIAADGMDDILVVPTHMIGGSENDKMVAAIREWEAQARPAPGAANPTGRTPGAENPIGPAPDTLVRRLPNIRISRPLLDSESDLKSLAEVIAGELLAPEAAAAAELPAPEAAAEAEPADLEHLVLMGHGSADKPKVNETYVKLEAEFHALGYKNVYIGTVEGKPSIEDVIERLSADMAGAVTLAPLMIVAGDHAINDMAGDDEASWKNRIVAAIPGVEVRPVLKGLGSYAGVQGMFADHAASAAGK